MLEQNVPNPFNPSTQIVYTVRAAGLRVDLDVFDVRGRLVRTLVDGRPSSGRVVVVWDGRDDDGREAPSGVYFYRLTAGRTTVTRRMTLLN
jgi:flagellar hook assembly protein FlgD